MKEQVYELLRQIPKGCVTTYGEIARKIGVKSYRAIGKIVGQNQDIPNTPCHRVVKSDGAVSGYAYGVDKKIALLKSENVIIQDGFVKDFKEKLYKF